MYDYKIIPSEGIIVQKLTGSITMEELKSLFITTKKDPLFSTNFGFVTDFRNASLSISIIEIKKAAEYLMKINESIGKTAFLVNKSIDTAKVMLFKEQMTPSILFSVYSTVAGASSFLNTDLQTYLDDDEFVREDFYL